MDNDLYKGDMLYTPIVKKWYYEVLITDFAVNGISLGLNCKKYNYDKTIVDSGTTNLRVPEEVFNNILIHLKKYDKVSTQKKKISNDKNQIYPHVVNHVNSSPQGNMT